MFCVNHLYPIDLIHISMVVAVFSVSFQCDRVSNKNDVIKMTGMMVVKTMLAFKLQLVF
jgi:hypothetical protein